MDNGEIEIMCSHDMIPFFVVVVVAVVVVVVVVNRHDIK